MKIIDIFTIVFILCLVYTVNAKKKINRKQKVEYHEPEKEESEEVEEKGYESTCYINIRLLPANHPIFMHPNTSDIVYPNRPFLHIYLNAKQEIEMHCPGQHLLLGNNIFAGFVTVKCAGGVMVEDATTIYNLETVECTGMVKSTVVQTGEPCFPKGEYIKVGLQLSDHRFLLLYTACFDYNRSTTHHVYNVVSEWANWSNLTARSNSWEGTFFMNCSARMKIMYTIKMQKESFNSLAGENMGSIRYINKGTHLRMGRLVPHDDFVYKFQRTSVNWFINIVPIWSRLNLFNWATVQRIVRRYASTKRIDLEVITGTYRQMQIYNVDSGTFHKFYLFPNGTGIPVPLYIWKLVYDPINKAGVVFIGLNNAHFRQLPEKSQFCNNVADRMGTLFPRGDTREYNYHSGYVFACTIEEFRETFPFLPNYEVNQLFTIV